MDSDTAVSFETDQQREPSYAGPFWLVPFDRNFSFVGRNDFFNEIDQALEVHDDNQPRVALCGIGGIGKTQVALEYSYRKRIKDPKCSIFWVNAATVARFEESFNRIATECGIGISDSAKSDATLLLKDWLELQYAGPWLMIIDNVDDEDAFFRVKMTIGKTPSECIPNCQNGSLLFTTRNHGLFFDSTDPTVSIMIHKLGTTEGIDLVRRQLQDNEPEDFMLELLEELEYIPLAIAQATAFMVKRQRTIRQYLEQFRRSDAIMTKYSDHEFSDQMRQENALDSVAKTWKLSFETIRSSNRKAADLLCLINFFQHHGVPAIILQDGDEVGESSQFQEAAELLKAYSLIDEDDLVFRTHRLVQLATRWWLEEENPQDVDKWAFEALKSITSQFPEPSGQPNNEYFKLGEVLLPHAEWILKYQFKEVTKDSDIIRARLLASSGRYIHWKGNYDEARARFQQSFEINCIYLGEKHVNTLTSMGLLGWTLSVFDQDLLSLPILQKLVELRREILGDDDPRTIDGLSDLATAIALTGDYAESERMQREALSRSKRVLGLKNNDTLNCMLHLSNVLDEQGKSEEAAKLLDEVYEIKKDLLGNLHPDTLVAEHNLAYMLCQNDESIDQGLFLLKCNLRNKIEILGPTHNETLTTVYNLITYLAMNDRVSEARALCEKYIIETRNIPHEINTRTREWLTRLATLKDSIVDGDDD